MTTIYNYHPSTCELISDSIADVSPLEPDVILLPAFATAVVPPAVPPGQVAVFDGAAWALLPDFRGVVYWLGASSFTIDKLGEVPPAGSADSAPVPALPEIKRQLMEGVDDSIGAIYSRFTRFEAEYVQREAAARAFVAAGYQGDAGVWVNSFASAAGLSYQAAADLIIGQADAMRAALQELGALRMGKYGIAAATDTAAARVVHDAIVTRATAIAAAL